MNGFFSALWQGNAKRSQAATAANEVSSRSHAVLQVVVESRDKAPGVVANIKVGKLSLVDLAGTTPPYHSTQLLMCSCYVTDVHVCHVSR